MKVVVTLAAWLVHAAYKVLERKWSFLFLYVLVFGVNLFVLARLNLLPTHKVVEVVVAARAATSILDTIPTALLEEPVRISVESIGLEAKISNPTVTTVTVLDAALLKGAVRYPTSAKLGENGNVVLFGHSSYLPIVHNQAYKTFDDIQKLKKGDVILVSSDTHVYTYAVTVIVKANTDTGAIPLSVTGRVLTLATCDSFGTKSDRFVVTAEFVESHSIVAS
jgi:LPXTG-site transpeptidase (sortase) family protein